MDWTRRLLALGVVGAVLVEWEHFVAARSCVVRANEVSFVRYTDSICFFTQKAVRDPTLVPESAVYAVLVTYHALPVWVMLTFEGRIGMTRRLACRQGRPQESFVTYPNGCAEFAGSRTVITIPTLEKLPSSPIRQCLTCTSQYLQSFPPIQQRL